MITIIKNNTLPEELKQGVSVIDFNATWCGPCKMIAPLVEELAIELDGQVKFYSADVDQNMDLAMAYGIASIPALAIVKDGQVKDMQVGFMPKENLMAAIKNVM